MYQVEFLPVARQGMIDIAKYISSDLCNPATIDEDEKKVTISRVIYFMGEGDSNGTEF